MKRIKDKKILLLLLVILLTGCNSKLKCEIKTRNYTSKVSITFNKDNAPVKYDFKDKMLFNVNDAGAEIYYHSKYDEYGILLAEKHGYMRNAPEYISLTIKYDFTKHNSKQENKLLVNKTDTKEIALTKLKEAGYTCK